MSQNLPTPDPDNVDALADAVNRFHGRLDRGLGDELIADVTRQFATKALNQATVVVHFTAGGEG